MKDGEGPHPGENLGQDGKVTGFSLAAAIPSEPSNLRTWP